MQLFKNNKCVKVFKANRPKFGAKKCTWMDETILIDEKEVSVFWECMRGKNYYFELDRQWYKIPFDIGSGYPYKINLDEIIHLDKFTTQGLNYVEKN
jgi:hypothetical protein